MVFWNNGIFNNCYLLTIIAFNKNHLPLTKISTNAQNPTNFFYHSFKLTNSFNNKQKPNEKKKRYLRPSKMKNDVKSNAQLNDETVYIRRV